MFLDNHTERYPTLIIKTNKLTSVLILHWDGSLILNKLCCMLSVSWIRKNMDATIKLFCTEYWLEYFLNYSTNLQIYTTSTSRLLKSIYHVHDVTGTLKYSKNIVFVLFLLVFLYHFFKCERILSLYLLYSLRSPVPII